MRCEGLTKKVSNTLTGIPHREENECMEGNFKSIWLRMSGISIRHQSTDPRSLEKP